MILKLCLLSWRKKWVCSNNCNSMKSVFSLMYIFICYFQQRFILIGVHTSNAMRNILHLLQFLCLNCVFHSVYFKELFFSSSQYFVNGFKELIYFLVPGIGKLSWPCTLKLSLMRINGNVHERFYYVIDMECLYSVRGMHMKHSKLPLTCNLYHSLWILEVKCVEYVEVAYVSCLLNINPAPHLSILLIIVKPYWFHALENVKVHWRMFHALSRYTWESFKCHSFEHLEIAKCKTTYNFLAWWEAVWSINKGTCEILWS